MKSFLASVLILASPALGWAQVPPNDEFTNRIPLTGPVAYFGGDISQATFPIDEFEPCAAEWCGPSVWWSWTAKDATPVVIERVGESSQQMSGMAVYLGESPSVMYHGTEVCRIDLQRRGQYVVFQPIPGIEYKILVSGFDTNPVTYRWTVTNAPVFRVQPLTQTINVGASTILHAFAIGTSPLRYQWELDGMEMPSATNQMISFDNAQYIHAGAYRVVVSSSTGSSTSQVAQLTVTTNDLPPRILPHGTNAAGRLTFSVQGEVGRRYRLDLSEDMMTWTGPRQGGAIFNTNSHARFSVPVDSPAKFLRLSSHRPANEICANHIRQLRCIIWMCAEENHMLETEPVGDGVRGQLDGYLIHGIWPMCPTSSNVYAGSLDYAMMDVVHIPVCLIEQDSHLLEDQ